MTKFLTDVQDESDPVIVIYLHFYALATAIKNILYFYMRGGEMTASCSCSHSELDGCCETMTPSPRNYIYIVLNCFTSNIVMTNVIGCSIKFRGKVLFQMNDVVLSSRVAGCLYWMAATQRRPLTPESRVCIPSPPVWLG